MAQRYQPQSDVMSALQRSPRSISKAAVAEGANSGATEVNSVGSTMINEPSVTLRDSTDTLRKT